MSTQTKTANKTDQSTADDQPRTRQDVATLQPARLPYHPVYQERYGVDGMMWRALVEAVFPSAKTVEGIILAISYCKSKNYDIMKKMVNVVPIWNSQLKKEVEGVWEAVAALRATAFRTGEYAGCDETKFGPTKVFHFDDEVGWGDKAARVQMDVEMPEWAQITVYRLIQGVRCAFPGPRVMYLGAYGCKGKSEIPNEKWGTSTDSYMLEKCAEAAALRKAFPEALGGVNAWEEMEGRKMNIPAGPTVDHDEPAPPRPTRESVKAEKAAADRTRKEQVANEAHARTINQETDKPAHDAETGEVHDEARDDVATGRSDETGNHGGQDATENQRSDDAGKPAGNGADVKAAGTKPANQAYAKLATDVIAAIKRTSRPATLKSLLEGEDYAQDLDTLRTEAKELYAEVMAAVGERRKYFAR